MRWLALALALAALAACAPGAAAPGPPRTVPLVCDGRQLEVEISADSASIERGLMFRRALAADAGMLFVFPFDTAPSFWMQNTFIPLSIAWIDAAGRIVGVADMTPFDATPHAAPSPVRFALEVNRGWFEERGVAPGATCDLRAFLS